MIAESRLRNAVQVLTIEFVPGTLPLSRFLNQWFKKNRQMGSKDRKILSNLLYDHFRCVHLLGGLEPDQQLMAARFLLNSEDSVLIPDLKPAWVAEMGLSFDKKLKLLKKWYPELKAGSLFPFSAELSPEIDAKAYNASYLTQPYLFIRVRTAYEDEVKACLVKHGIEFKQIGTSCFQLDNQTRVDFLAEECPGLTEVQDLSSQLCGTYFTPAEESSWWDCCAGAGGKTLLLADIEPNVRIYASDYRETILENLRERMLHAGQRARKVFQVDLLHGTNLPTADLVFDGIILDAPCSGSGTWARTPEMLASFSPEAITRFSEMQYTIAMQVIPYLKKGAPLIYITCSVFAAENEELTKRLLETGLVTADKQEYLKGYDKGADTLFIARLVKA